MSDPSSLSRPGRTAGLILLGIAGLALVVGGITALTGNGNGADGAAPPPEQPGASTPAPTGTGEQTTRPERPTGQKPAPTTTRQPRPPQGGTPGRTPGRGQGDDGQQAGAGRGDGQRAVSPAPVRVYNNSTIKGLADNAARDLRAEGWNVTEVGNYSGGTIAASTVYYRPGTGEEAAAKQLAYNFGMRAEPRFAGISDAPPGVIVIVTKNYESESEK
ncbi:MAG: LytR family transcriptional regulator [Pseudonocardiaceae bacterium]|nr:LytR family transcriptional regulator [Pseudonocardiaceae bacterium]